jgi:anti-sigma factor RsiW
MHCADRGPDLVARALGQLDPAAAAELESHLAACAECRSEAEACSRHALASSSAPPAPPRALRARLLAAVRDEAGERRAEAAVAAARSCPDVREDLPALVLGQLDAAAKSRAEAHAASCDACADERRGVEKLVHAHRSAVRPQAPAALRARLLDEVRTTRLDAVPPPLRVVESRRARERVRRLSLLVPLAAAATVLAALSLSAPAVGLHVQDDVGALFLPRNGDAAGRWIDRSAGELRLRPGEGVAAGNHPVEVRLRFDGRRASDPSSDEPNAGEVRLRLQPGTRLVRVDDECFELESGRVAVHAGRLDTRLTFRHGPNYAAVVGTRFEAAVVGDRLVVSVAEGRVEVGERDGRSVAIGPGEDALAHGARLLTRRADGTPAVDAFLAPEASLATRGTVIRAGAPLDLDAELRAGPGGPVTIPAFDDSDPRFLVRLKGPDGRTLEAKVQRSMLTGPVPAVPAFRLEPAAPYRLAIRVEGLRLDPGRWTASLRFQAYGGRSDGAEWHGTVESPPAPFEVTAE